ncbi:N-formylmaleamate deformylase [Pseudovibrio axinellae]|uniref:N-formylmaleamate deformylase n=1 Tax=Pseudovibrio axinellae TaxID=989403 RepID=A0A165VSH7_9HYPH|nr:alpha/beta hydrolase [Pseudovibrio axinellae]KZL15376.1 N-formylmaleamate deformylase [Pseudovibrio axinellae]SER53861.1 Pimeloyl-ACP methyl ester carboxylesterase [Pseudovibrio axinellae]
MIEVDECKYDSGAYENEWFMTADGLRLNYRVYGQPTHKAPAIIAVPGLTRCVRDLDPMAAELGKRFRVYTLNLRGRDLSDYDPDYRNYKTSVYIDDIYAFWRFTGEERVVLLGSSLGALLAMLMVQDHPDMLAGTVLNDLGATIELVGMARILSYVGRLTDEPDLAIVICTLKQHLGSQFVDLPEAKWERMALAMFGLNKGKWHNRYDDNLGVALLRNKEWPRDLWAAHKQAAYLNLPILSLRGALSDVTSVNTVRLMMQMAPNMRAADIPQRGHCPILDEPQSLEALTGYMNQFENRA